MSFSHHDMPQWQIVATGTALVTSFLSTGCGRRCKGHRLSLARQTDDCNWDDRQTVTMTLPGKVTTAMRLTDSDTHAARQNDNCDDAADRNNDIAGKVTTAMALTDSDNHTEKVDALCRAEAGRGLTCRLAYMPISRCCMAWAGSPYSSRAAVYPSSMHLQDVEKRGCGSFKATKVL